MLYADGWGCPTPLIPVPSPPSQAKPTTTTVTYKRQPQTEFDDMLNMLDEEDLAELASESVWAAVVGMVPIV